MNASITLLGTGHGNVSPSRFQASILLRARDGIFLLDAGEPCAQRLRALGERPGGLDAVVLTHGHADHAGGMALLAQAMWGDGRAAPIPLYAPADLLGPLGAWLDYALSLLPPRDGLRMEPRVLQDGQCVAVGPLSVTPHRTTHLAPPRESFLLDVRFGGKRLVYSGDIGAASDLDRVVVEPASVLVCEVSHVEPDDLEPVLRRARLDMLILTHVAEGYGIEELRARFAGNLPGVGEVFTPEDGATFDF